MFRWGGKLGGGGGVGFTSAPLSSHHHQPPTPTSSSLVFEHSQNAAPTWAGVWTSWAQSSGSSNLIRALTGSPGQMVGRGGPSLGLSQWHCKLDIERERDIEREVEEERGRGGRDKGGREMGDSIAQWLEYLTSKRGCRFKYPSSVALQKSI